MAMSWEKRQFSFLTFCLFPQTPVQKWSELGHHKFWTASIMDISKQSVRYAMIRLVPKILYGFYSCCCYWNRYMGKQKLHLGVPIEIKDPRLATNEKKMWPIGDGTSHISWNLDTAVCLLTLVIPRNREQGYIKISLLLLIFITILNGALTICHWTWYSWSKM